MFFQPLRYGERKICLPVVGVNELWLRFPVTSLSTNTDAWLLYVRLTEVKVGNLIRDGDSPWLFGVVGNRGLKAL